MGLQEAPGAEAPLVPGLQAGEVELGPRRGQVIPDILGIRQELRCQHGADRMAAAVFGTGVARAVAKKAGERIA